MEEPEEENINSESSSNSSFASSSDRQSSSTSSQASWVAWFVGSPGNELFVHVPEEFIEDDFNLTGLASIVPMYSEALDTILDLELDDSPDDNEITVIEFSAIQLYGLIHSRYIVTKQGLEAIYDKYIASEFGTCPRLLCDKAKVIPVGRSDKLGSDTVKLFCPRCLDIYSTRDVRHKQIDGAFFSTSMCHLFFLTYPEMVPPLHEVEPSKRDDGEDVEEETEMEKYEIYTMKIFGFRVNEASQSGPQMQWLRWRDTGKIM